MLISWGTVGVYLACAVALLILFALTYADSVIHCWNERTDLASGFWASRLEAHLTICKDNSYFAMSSRFTDNTLQPISGVHQYIPYVTDGALVLLSVLALAGVGFLIAVLPPQLFPRGH